MRTLPPHIESIVSRLAFGATFGPLTWGQVAALRIRYWKAGNDSKKRLGCLKAFLRRRARFRIFACPGIAAAILIAVAAVSGSPIAWIAGAVAAAVSGTTLAARSALLAWLDRAVLNAGRSESVDSAEADKTCEDFEFHVAALRAAGEDRFLGFAGSGAVSVPPARSWRAERGDPLERFDRHAIAGR
jgi:hypothetical protein